MLLLLFLIWPAPSSCSLSVQQMRRVLAGEATGPQAYTKLGQLYRYPESMRTMGNTVRTYQLSPTHMGEYTKLIMGSGEWPMTQGVVGVELHLHLPSLVLEPGVDGIVSLVVRRELPHGIRDDQYVIGWRDGWVQLNVSQSLDQLNYWLTRDICLFVMSPLIYEDNDSPINYTDETRPFLMVWTMEGLSLPPTAKTRRSFSKHNRDKFRETALQHSNIPVRNKGKGFDRCSLVPMYVDFRDVGWESWIIAPPGLEVGTCAGMCFRDDSSSTYNILINTILRDPDLFRVYGIAGVRIEQCCVPTAFFPSVIMFVDSRQNIVVQLVEDAIIASCGCV